MSWRWNGTPDEYKLSDEDLLNLARAAYYEGKPEIDVIRTLLQRYAMLRSTGYGNQYPTLTRFLQSYVQPINPRWFPTGDLHLERVRQLVVAGKAKEAELENAAAKNRVKKATASWLAIPGAIRTLVSRVTEGKLVNSQPSYTVHYWASRASASMSREQARAHNQSLKPDMQIVDTGSGFGPGVNVFFNTPASRKALTDVALALDTGTNMGPLIVASILAFAAWKVWG
jgi:hypothetical protein